MLRGLYTSWSGLVNEQNRMDIMTNNLANATTVGYKKEGSTSQSFDDVLTLKIKDASVGLSNVQRTGVRNPGVKIGENYTDFSQGSFRETGNTLDLALSGEGFFTVEFTPKGGSATKLYTRSGQFSMDKDGYLVTTEGDYVLDTQDRRIQLNTNLDVDIDASGRISQEGRAVAQLQITNFGDYNYLEKYGETYFQPVAGARTVNPSATVRSGYLEMSNVQVVSEMVNLIAITRAYESNQKLVQTYDDSLQIAVSQLGRLS